METKSILIIIVMLAVSGFILYSVFIKEQFTDDQNNLVADLLKYFNTGSVTYMGYLNLLTQHKNTSTKLALLNTFNTLKDTKGISLATIQNYL